MDDDDDDDAVITPAHSPPLEAWMAPYMPQETWKPTRRESAGIGNLDDLNWFGHIKSSKRFHQNSTLNAHSM